MDDVCFFLLILTLSNGGLLIALILLLVELAGAWIELLARPVHFSELLLLLILS